MCVHCIESSCRESGREKEMRIDGLDCDGNNIKREQLRHIGRILRGVLLKKIQGKEWSVDGWSRGECKTMQ